MVDKNTESRESVGASATVGRNTALRMRGDDKPAIRAADLQHFYGQGDLRKQVLYDNSIEIFPGEIIIMTGPSGSGKTTLLTLIGTLRRAQEGVLNVLGRNLYSASDRELFELRREIGFIFQAHNLFDSLTATQNVRMALELAQPKGSRREHTETAIKMLESVGLGERTDHRPRQLSGGQKQRVAIARGLVHRPRLVLADEPTAALDEESGRTVVELLKTMAKEDGVTIVIVTHDNRILGAADRIVNLVDGRIKSDASAQETAELGEMLRQCEVFRHLTPRSLAEMVDHLVPVEFPAKKRVIQEGDIGDKFYLIRRGSVEVSRGTPGTRLATLNAGNFFGEMALLTGQPRNASVDTTSDSLLYEMSKAEFQKAISAQASFETEIRNSLFDRQ